MSAALITALRQPPHPFPAPSPSPQAADPLSDDDVQLALYCCYELHYRGFDQVDEGWEWQPSLLTFRAALEALFEPALRAAVGEPAPSRDPIPVALRRLASADGVSVARHLERAGTRAQLLEFLVHRSAYQLKEADPHSWALPRLSGRPKAALVEIQADEYGGGRWDRMHAQLFADVLEAVGLNPAYGAYLDLIPGITLATVNLMSLCGLHRRLRGALAGHLALFEMTSSLPNRRYATALRRLGFTSTAATEFFDVHVLADAVHDCIAAVDLAGGLAQAEPQLAADILWGARALDAIERRWARHLLGAWKRGGSSLRTAPTVTLPVSCLATARSPEPDDLVRAVAEGAGPGLAAAAQRHR